MLMNSSSSPRCVWVNGPVIVGAGPSGLAVAAGLRNHGVPFVILERSSHVASLWQDRTYDRLRLHLPKSFCQLPGLPFPPHYPEYPSRNQFVSYLESYAAHFAIFPHFNETVQSAKYDDGCGLWRVRSVDGEGMEVEYVCEWVVVATGENAEPVIPAVEGLGEFEGEVVHAGDYKCGERYRGKTVVVVGCGNSGMEVSLDLANHGAHPSLVVRSSVHVLPREVFGKSTFEVAMFLLKWIPVWLVDKILLILSWIILGNIEKYGLKMPSIGPLELKDTQGKTPVLDIGALGKIKSGEVKVVPGIKRFSCGSIELVNGEKLSTDAVILATGYRSNVPYWLQDLEFFGKNGYPNTSFPNGWKGNRGLYTAGFTRRGLAGASFDAVKVSQDIYKAWKDGLKQKKQKVSPLRISISTF